MKKERLQKLLSKHGYGSRRACERLISEKRVRLNNKIARLGDRGSLDEDLIEVDSDQISRKKINKIYIALNKPQRILSEIKKQDDRKNISDLITLKEYFFVVGRLDYMSEGLLLLTNDGGLTNKLTHPRYAHEKEYIVLIQNKPDQKQLNEWRKGVVLKNKYNTKPTKVSIVEQNESNTWLKIIMKEGKKRQIRETGKLLGLPVQRIIRTRIASIELGTLKVGEWRYLSDQEIQKLKKLLK